MLRKDWTTSFIPRQLFFVKKNQGLITTAEKFRRLNVPLLLIIDTKKVGKMSDSVVSGHPAMGASNEEVSWRYKVAPQPVNKTIKISKRCRNFTQRKRGGATGRPGRKPRAAVVLSGISKRGTVSKHTTKRELFEEKMKALPFRAKRPCRSLEPLKSPKLLTPSAPAKCQRRKLIIEFELEICVLCKMVRLGPINSQNWKPKMQL